MNTKGQIRESWDQTGSWTLEGNLCYISQIIGASQGGIMTKYFAMLLSGMKWTAERIIQRIHVSR